jgi:molecular chaperone GrpE
MTRKDHKPNRIPVRFIEVEGSSPAESEAVEEPPGDGYLEGSSSEERKDAASEYEDEAGNGPAGAAGPAGPGGPDDQWLGAEADDLYGFAGGEQPEIVELVDDDDNDEQASSFVTSPAHPDQHSAVRAPDPAAGPVMAELVATRAELKRIEGANAELKETLARRQADFENFRKRIERERSESYHRVVAEVVTKLLPVMDNLRRALHAEASAEAGESQEFRNFLHGVELISHQLADALEGLGLQQVASVGHPFDPHLHEAVATEQSDEHEPDTVVQELVRGYRIGDKLLRPAIVKVSVR